MLTSEERRQLAEIERSLEADSPRLAVALSRGEPPAGGWQVGACAAMWCLMPLVAVITGTIIAVVVGAILLLVTIRLWLTNQ